MCVDSHMCLWFQPKRQEAPLPFSRLDALAMNPFFFPAMLIVLQWELAQNIWPNFVIKEVFSCYNYSSFARSSSPSFVYFFLLSLSSSFMVRFPLCLLCPQCHNLALAIFSVHLPISCFLLPFYVSFLTSFFIESASIIMAESSNYLPEF